MSDTVPTRPPASSDDSELHLGPKVFVRRADITMSYARSSGPGGQHVNKVNTKAELRVKLGDIQGLPSDAADRLRKLAGQKLTQDDELLITCDANRSQRRNRDEAEERLADLVRRALVKPKSRKRRRRTRAMIENRLQKKRENAEKKARRNWQHNQ